MMTNQHPTHRPQPKTLLRDVHPAVWRRVRLADRLSIADLHRVIQVLMGWDNARQIPARQAHAPPRSMQPARRCSISTSV
jgi:hypothetical protein